MRRVRLRLAMLHRRFPGLGYSLALGLCLAVVTIGRGEWNWEPVWFIALPTLLGMAHFAAPRDRRGGRAYWTLAAIWLAAALTGVSSHWERLDSAAPWLSLVRYALVVIGGTMMLLSHLLGKGEFAADPMPHEGKWYARAVGGVHLLAFWLLVGVIVAHISFPVALAPLHRGATVKTVFVSSDDGIPMRVSWSPDSSRAIMILRGGIWLVKPMDGRVACTQAKGLVSGDRPWLPSGEGFLFTRKEGERFAVWVASAEGKPIRKLLEDASSATCAPHGRSIAFWRREAVWMADADGSHARVLAKDGVSPAWVPDGSGIVFSRRQRIGKHDWQLSLWMISLSGHQERLLFQIDQPWEFHWLSRDSYATSVIPHSSSSFHDLLLGQRSGIEEHTLDGRVRPLVILRSSLSLPLAFAASPDGTRLAFGEGFAVTAIRDAWLHSMAGSRGWISILDLDKRRIRRVRGPEVVWEMAWSPDGKSLAAIGTDYSFAYDGRSSGVASKSRTSVAVVSGL